MTQSPIEQPRTAGQEIKNLADVSVRTLSDTPKAFYDELCDDFSKRLPTVVARVGEGAAIGVATTLLLKVPRVAPLAIGAGLLYTGYKALGSTLDFMGDAAKADTSAQRSAVANKSSHELGGTLSAMLESTPGMIAGGYGISKSLGAPPLYTRVGNSIERSVLAPVREGYAFRGPGSAKLSSALLNQEGELDALTVSKTLAQRHPWQGVETGSTIDLARMRVSRAVSGESDIISTLPGSVSDKVVPFHIHGPKAGAGFLPSNVDMASTPGLGILQQGDATTFYVGQASDYKTLAKAGNGEYFSPSMRAVVVNSKTGVAQRFMGQWVLGKGAQLDPPVTLDFEKALEAIGRVKTSDPWYSLAAIAKKPGG